MFDKRQYQPQSFQNEESYSSNPVKMMKMYFLLFLFLLYIVEKKYCHYLQLSFFQYLTALT